MRIDPRTRSLMIFCAIVIALMAAFDASCACESRPWTHANVRLRCGPQPVAHDHASE